MENIELTTSRCCFSSNDEEFVGFKEDVEQIIQKLTRGTKEREVISIVGMAGLGKTTLARKVYNSHSIADHFDAHAFCIDEDAAYIRGRPFIAKRYLIVLDDMWNYEAWEDLQSWFLCGNRSRIMDLKLLETVGTASCDCVECRIIAQKERRSLVWKKFAKDLSSLGLEEQSAKALNQSRVSTQQRTIPENLEKSSKDCLSDLVNRSLLMVSKKAIKCFAQVNLKKKILNNAIVSYNSSSQVPSPPKDPNFMHLNGYSPDKISMMDSRKESLEFIAHPRFFSSKCMDLFSLLINWRLVRVLHLLDINMESTWEFQNSPASTLESLTHLKYLAIFFSFIWEDDEQEQIRVRQLKNFWQMSCISGDMNQVRYKYCEDCKNLRLSSYFYTFPQQQSAMGCYRSRVQSPQIFETRASRYESRVPDTSFPMLKELVIKDCEQLEEIPSSHGYSNTTID
ncbi:hypothetical protein H5410_025261 [Solanum commersonii]|uniref:NB-ARC domain-containing protein n=1 Tax=Solanum commersonii TaxID=4109 RepID=A0A9J5YTA2_SOLCO|nr:hypothetical protein H5410_025261 [Solanum commersonii]